MIGKKNTSAAEMVKNIVLVPKEKFIVSLPRMII